MTTCYDTFFFPINSCAFRFSYSDTQCTSNFLIVRRRLRPFKWNEKVVVKPTSWCLRLMIQLKQTFPSVINFYWRENYSGHRRPITKISHSYSIQYFLSILPKFCEMSALLTSVFVSVMMQWSRSSRQTALKPC